LTFLEFNYMLMQSYDFLVLNRKYGCVLQCGGDDQWSNMLGGTELIRRKLGKDAHCMTITLLTDSQGNKMGKTAGNAVWLDPNKTSPYDFYQYWRNVEDADVLKCLRMLTFLPIEQIQEMDGWEGSQLNRANEKREDKRPMLSDLRDSGAIEQDADIVMFLYREDYYREESENRNIAECIVAKNRHGETGKIPLRWTPEYTTFSTVEMRFDEDE